MADGPGGPRGSVDDADFADFVRARSDSLHRVAYLMTGNREQAQDAVQTALTRIYVAWPRRAGWGDRDAYARRVVTNVILSSVRRRWWGEKPTGELPETPSEDGSAVVAERDALRRALLSLPVRQRTAVVLRHYMDLSEADTAAAMDCAVGTVKSLTSRALGVLRSQLTEVAS